MSISIGTRLGPYEIVAPLGAGGMGEVWKARDTRLERSVAIKVLPAEFSRNAQLKLRFEREAKAISQLQHPHICTLFDVGEVQLAAPAPHTISYLVMELLEGESLADRLDRGSLPIAETLKIGAQIAEALDRAHRAGIVHRDLKPGNVMLTKSGAKLLDFGLAKSAAPPVVSVEGATEHRPLTQEGTILGTFQYMAPEQLEALEADARTDIFALGAVLYEMATGKRAFQGKTKTSLIANIVQGEPQPISAIQPLTPPAFEHVVAKCLEKDPDRRWQSAFDVAEELRWIGGGGAALAVTIPVGRSRRLLLAIAIAAALSLAALAGWLAARRFSGPRPEVFQFDLSVPDLRRYALSPDGRSIAFTTSTSGGVTLWVQSFRDEAPRRLMDANLTADPFWSPDGTMIGVFADDMVKTVPVAGGTPQTICEAPAGASGSWSSNGTIIYEAGGSVYRVSDRGGEPAPVLASKPGAYYYSPDFLPDGEHFLVIVSAVPEISDAIRNSRAVASLKTRTVTKLFETSGGGTGRYVEPGYMVYRMADKLIARAFDARSLHVTGEPLVIRDARFIGWDASRSGSIAYRAAAAEAQDAIVVVDRAGHELRTVGAPAPVWHIALAPDERHIALEIYDPKARTTDVWTRDIETGRVTARLTFTPRFEWQMIWSPDGSRIYFASNQNDNSDVYVIPATGGAPSLVYRGPVMQAPMDVSRDGKYLLVYDTTHGFNNVDILAVPLAGGAVVPVAATQFNERTARFSPDGTWLAYDSDKSGRREVYLQDFPGATKSIQISSEGGHHPAWSSDGRELYYMDEKKLIAVPVEHLSPEPRLGAPVALFDLPSAGRRGFARYNYAPARNGREFYVIKEISPRVDSPIHVAMNAAWTLAEDRSH